MRPNILLITCHDIGQHLGCYGVDSLTTPNIDRLASNGVRFHNMYSTSAVCSPGRGSLHTGRYPQSNGLMGLTHAPWWWKLNSWEKHAAHLLSDTGYETYLVGFNHVGEPESLGYRQIRSQACRADETVSHTHEIILSAATSQKPFFAHIGFSEVHRPFHHGEDRARGVFVPPWLAQTQANVDDLTAFQAEIRYFDKQVGEILSVLEANTDVAARTLVIFTSDHGIPYAGAKWTVRKAGIEIPLIVYQPKSVFSGGTVMHEIMSNVDILPTMLDYLEAPVPANVQGETFMPMLRGEVRTPPREKAFSQYTPDMKRDNLSRCVITDRFHLIRYFDQGREVGYPVDVDPIGYANHEQRCRTTGPRPFCQLYDIQADPYELNDLGSDPEHAFTISTLSHDLLNWMTSVDDPLLEGPLLTPYYERAIHDFRSGSSFYS